MRLKYSKSRSTGFDSSGLQRGARSGSALFSRMSLAGGQRLLREIDYDALSLHDGLLPLCGLGARCRGKAAARPAYFWPSSRINLLTLWWDGGTR